MGEVSGESGSNHTVGWSGFCHLERGQTDRTGQGGDCTSCHYCVALNEGPCLQTHKHTDPALFSGRGSRVQVVHDALLKLCDQWQACDLHIFELKDRQNAAAAAASRECVKCAPPKLLEVFGSAGAVDL